MAGLLGIMPGEWDGDIGSQRMQYGLLGLAGLSSMFENQGPRYTTNLAEATTPRQNTFMQSLPAQMIAIQREQRQRQRDEMMNRLYGTQIKKAEREDANQAELSGAARDYFSRTSPQMTTTNQQGVPTLPDAPDGMRTAVPGTGPTSAGLLQDPRFRSALYATNPIAAAQLEQKDDAPIKIGQGETLLDKNTRQPIYTAPQKGPEPTNLAKLQAELDAMPQTDPRRSVWQNMIKKESERDPYVISTVQTPQGPMPFAAPRPGTGAAPLPANVGQGGGQAQPNGPVNPYAGQLPPGSRPLAVPQQPAFTDAQLEKFRQADQSRTQFKSATEAFEKALQEGGGTGFNTWVNNPNDPKAVRINTAYNNMLALLRGESLYNTGVLQAGELGWLNSIFLNPQSLRGAIADPQAFATQMAEMRKLADSNYEAMRGSFANQAQNIKAMRGGDVPPPAAASTSQQAGPRQPPKRGEVRDGWEFVGGDPANKLNWRKAK